MKIRAVGLTESGLDCTYFRTREIVPVVDGDTLTIIDGRGSRRHWGTPSVNSRVDTLAENAIRVSVTGWHKWTITPVGGTYYFVRNSNGIWQRKTANSNIVRSLINQE